MNATTSRRPRALLLDDDPTALRLLGAALSSRGFDVRAARDGEAGLELLLDELLELDVLVIDRDLPGRGGESLLRLVREAGGETDLAVVVVTGDAGAARRLLALGADAVVDRAQGPRAVVDAIVAAAPRRAERERLRLDAAGAPARGTLLVTRGAHPPAIRLVPCAA